MEQANRIAFSLPRAQFKLSVELSLPTQGITVLWGASGSGKTSLLRCVAGLERAQDAFIQMSGKTWQDDSKNFFLPTWRRSIGYVFQEASLFSHLNVKQNLEYGFKRAGTGLTNKELEAQIDYLDIRPLLKRFPENLSGGERQRVAILRALFTKPDVLLLDEPLASLDRNRRQEILPWFEKIRDELKVPALYVTHSIEEAARLADHLVVLEQGQIKIKGPISEALANLKNPVILGDETGVLLQGTITERDFAWHLVRVCFKGGSLWIPDDGLAVGTSVRLRVLARDVSLTTEEPHHTSIQNHLQGRIEYILPDKHPAAVWVQVNCSGTVLLSRMTQRAVVMLELQPQSKVWAQIKSVAVMR